MDLTTNALGPVDLLATSTESGRMVKCVGPPDSSEPPCSQMGSGSNAEEKDAASIKNMKLTDKEGDEQAVDLDNAIDKVGHGNSTKKFVDTNPRFTYYNLIRTEGDSFSYGGPGKC
jgi:hypothetical protein